MKDILEMALPCLTIAAVIGMILFAINSCSRQDAELKSECIKAGGSVIVNGPSFHCVRIRT